MAPDRLVPRPPGGASAPSAYCEGNTGREMGQGQSLATPPNPLVSRQGPCRETSDGKSGQTNTWGGWGNLGHPTQESTGNTDAPSKRIPSSPTQAHLHPQEQWPEAPP